MAADMADVRDHGTELNGIGGGRWHRVHVGAVRHERAGPAAAKDADNTVTTNACSHLEAKRLQCRRHDSGSPHFLAGNFGMAVQVSSSFDETWRDGVDVRGNARVDVRRRRLHERDERRDQEGASQSPPFGRLIGGTMLFMR